MTDSSLLQPAEAPRFDLTPSGYVDRVDLTVSSDHLGSTSIVSASGEIDLSTAETFKTALDEAMASGAREVIVDLGQVTFLDSTGIGVLAGTLRSRSERSVGLVVSGGPVEKVLMLTGMDRVFPMYQSQEDAIADLVGPAKT